MKRFTFLAIACFTLLIGLTMTESQPMHAQTGNNAEIVTPSVTPTSNVADKETIHLIQQLIEAQRPPISATVTSNERQSNLATGTVTEQGVPLANTTLVLRRSTDSGSTWSDYATAMTNASGSYQFTLPALGSNHQLQVQWNNEDNGNNSNRLVGWSCNRISASSAVYPCSFDVTDVVPTFPAHKTTVSLPVSFSWARRGITADSYDISLFDSTFTSFWLSDELGDVSSYTLTALPSGFTFNNSYGWWVSVNGTNGYGLAYYYRTVTFSSTPIAIPTSTPVGLATVVGTPNFVYLPLISRQPTPIPTNTPTPTKTPTNTPTPTKVPNTSTIINGNFESGNFGWTEFSSSGFDLITNNELPLNPHSGSWLAWLGGDDDETSIIEQQVTVPTQAPYLTFWFVINSEDDCGYDVSGIFVNEEVVASAWLCTDTDTGGWVQGSVDLRAYAGQSITLSFLAATDEGYLSDFLIDDVAFQANQVTAQGVVITSFGTMDAALSKRIEELVK